MTSDEQLIHSLYEAFNKRDLEALLAALDDDVAWADSMEGTHVHGRDAVRAYWPIQWSFFNVIVKPVSIVVKDGGVILVEVHQVIRDPEGVLLFDEVMHHFMRIKDGRLLRLDIVEPAES